jgi:hypothetical protein
MNSNDSPEWAAAKLFICRCHMEVFVALFYHCALYIPEMDPEDNLIGILCLTLLPLYVMHIILCNPQLLRWCCNPHLLRWCCERMQRVTPAIEQRERALDPCSICMEQIIIRDGRACTYKGGVVKLVCGHYFHDLCLKDLFAGAPRFGYNLKCPLCRRHIQIYWIDHCFYYFPGSSGASETAPRVVSVVNLWIFTLLQLPMLMLLIIVSIDPISMLCRSVVRSFIPVTSLDNSFPLRCVIAAFSFLTGMELPATYFPLLELPATYVPLLA